MIETLLQCFAAGLIVIGFVAAVSWRLAGSLNPRRFDVEWDRERTWAPKE